MERLDELVQEESFSLARAAFLIAKEAPLNNEFELESYEEKLSEFANQLKPKIVNKKPKEIIRALNKYIFREQGFSFKKDVFLLNKVLDVKAGDCKGLSTLYLALAEKLQLPIHGIDYFFHTIVRWDDGSYRRNIEPSLEGKELADVHYMRLYGEGRKLTKQGFIALLLSAVGNVQIQLGNYEAALQSYERALKLDPSAPNYYGRGTAYLMMGKFDDALSDLTKALEPCCIPFLALVHAGKGNAYFGKGELEKALRHYNTALRLNPSSANVYYNRAILNLKLGKTKEALKDLKIAKIFAPNSKHILSAYKRIKLK